MNLVSFAVWAPLSNALIDFLLSDFSPHRFDVDMLNMNIALFDQVFGEVPVDVAAEDTW